jgi:hypothetical protein
MIDVETKREVPDSWSRSQDKETGHSAFIGLYDDGRSFVLYDTPKIENHCDAPSIGEWIDFDKAASDLPGNKYRKMEQLSFQLLRAYVEKCESEVKK